MSKRDADMDEEIAAHVDSLTQQNLATGMTPAEARRRALLTFGPPEALREIARAQRSMAWLGHFLQDLHYAFRMLRKNPGFTVVAVLTLALGIGATTAMFSVVDGVLLRPLAYPDPQQLVRVLERGQSGGMTVNHANFADWKAQQTVFSQLGLWRRGTLNFTSRGDLPQRIESAQVTPEIFFALGVAPALGRTFRAEDDRPGAAPLVLASHEFWVGGLGGDPARVGQSITLDGRRRVVIGVMPPGFVFPSNAKLWEPLGADMPEWSSRVRRVGLRAIGRLAPDVTIEQASAELNTIAARLAQLYPESNRDVRVQVDALLESQVAEFHRALWTLLGAAALVLLIACANMAGLLLARAVARGREMALRAALGAERGRIIFQLLTESLLLAITGTLAGLFVAHATVRLVLSVAGSQIPRAAEIGLDGRVLAFSIAVALATGIGFGLAPAWRSSRLDLQTTLKQGTAGTVAGRFRSRRILVVGQVGLTLALLTGAGLLLRSYHNLGQVNPGYVAERVLSFRLSLPEHKYPAPSRPVFFENLLARLRALPGVEAAALSSQIPLDERSSDACVFAVGQPVPKLDQCPSSELHLVDGAYFRTLGIPLLQGRTFSRDDHGAPLRAAIIDDQLAHRLWPRENALGRQLTFPVAPDPRLPPPVLTVVGIVPRVKLDRIGERQTRTQIYLPSAQMVPAPAGMTAVVKTTLTTAAAITSVRGEVLALDPEQPLSEVRTLSELRDLNLAPERLNLVLLALFAALALVLAVVGLYGLLAHSVEQQRREIGVRMALGAGRARVLRQVVGEGLALVGAGMVLGLGITCALSRVMATLLFDVTPTDPVTLAIVATVVFLVGVGACLIPGRRAVVLDPMQILRHE